MLVHIFGGLAGYIIKRCAAIWKPAAAPEGAHLSLNSAQRLFAFRTIMQALVIAAVVRFGSRFGHSFGQSLGSSLVVAGARNVRHSPPIGCNYASRSNWATQRFITQTGAQVVLSQRLVPRFLHPCQLKYVVCRVVGLGRNSALGYCVALIAGKVFRRLAILESDTK